MSSRFSIVILVSAFLSMPASAHGIFDFLTGGSEPKPGEVIVEKEAEYNKPYKERRGKHGVLFSVNLERFYPGEYKSLMKDAFIESIIGTDRIDLLGAELGYKYNFELGSIAVLGSFASGGASGSVAAVSRTLSFVRQGLAVNYAFDNFLQEPWVVPYGQLGFHQFLVTETSPTSSQSATTGFALNYKFGVLFQLNWIEKSIDPSTQGDGLRASGLENTFFDLYYMAHMASSNTADPADINSDGDPNLQAEGELGFGLKIEF